MPAVPQKNICENYSKSQEETVNIVTCNSVTLAVFQGWVEYGVCSKSTVRSASFLSIYTDSVFICYQLMADTATGRNSCIFTIYQKCLWTCVSLWVQRPTGQAQDS